MRIDSYEDNICFLLGTGKEHCFFFCDAQGRTAMGSLKTNVALHPLTVIGLLVESSIKSNLLCPHMEQEENQCGKKHV